MREASAGAIAAASMICDQSKRKNSRKMLITAKTALTKMPWKKSVTITAIWPPRKVKVREMASRKAMMAA